jgi:hypothetical protein
MTYALQTPWRLYMGKSSDDEVTLVMTPGLAPYEVGIPSLSSLL